MGSDDDFQASIRSQAFTATHEADVIILIVDGKTGINADDEEVARMLRKSKKPVLVAVNKLDTPNRYDEMYEFYQLGLGDPWPISSIHGHGTGDLLDEVVKQLRETGAVERATQVEDTAASTWPSSAARTPASRRSRTR